MESQILFHTKTYNYIITGLKICESHILALLIMNSPTVDLSREEK